MSSKKLVDIAWGKAAPIRGQNPNVYRRDQCKNKIRKQSYGTKGEYGWEVDHKRPLAKGGSDTSRNIQALHWKENRKKSDAYPYRYKKK
jgi:5-methylcytosine-specific restriction endonuclease McrA